MISVWVGAGLALRGNRRSLRQERALTAAERCLAAVDQASDDYRRIDLSMKRHSEATGVQFNNNVTDRITSAFDKFVNSEIGHEAWLLENRAIMFGIADCLNGSMQLHLDSFLIAPSELRSKMDDLSSRLWSVGEGLRASILDKPISELTDRDRAAIQALLPGRHIKKG